jgi:hypothetical protein
VEIGAGGVDVRTESLVALIAGGIACDTPPYVAAAEPAAAETAFTLDKLPYEAIGADLTKPLATADGVLEDAGKALNRVDADVTPELRASLEKLRRMMPSGQ